MYKLGDKIKIISMKDEPQYSGKEGVIEFIDSIGQLHGTWGGCALIPEVDKFEVICEEVNKCCLCGKDIIGYGHNAEPLKSGLCCDECNNKVIMARLGAVRK